jgi:hypothetical protein
MADVLNIIILDLAIIKFNEYRIIIKKNQAEQEVYD